MYYASLQNWAESIRVIGAEIDILDEEMEDIMSPVFHGIDDVRTKSAKIGLSLGFAARDLWDWRTRVDLRLRYSGGHEANDLQGLQQLIANLRKRVEDLLDKIGIKNAYTTQ